MEASKIADMALATWRDLAAALSPIIGQRGVAAPYKRSLRFTCASHPWLENADKGALSPSALSATDLDALREVLAQQTDLEAGAASGALLQNLQGLLSSLIGPSLTERLLRSACDPTSSGQAAQDLRHDS